MYIFNDMQRSKIQNQCFHLNIFVKRAAVIPKTAYFNGLLTPGGDDVVSYGSSAQVLEADSINTGEKTIIFYSQSFPAQTKIFLALV